MPKINDVVNYMTDAESCALSAFVNAMIVCDIQQRRGFEVSKATKLAQSLFNVLEGMSAQRIVESIVAVIKARDSLVCYDFARPASWSVDFSKTVGCDAHGIIWLYDSENHGGRPFAYTPSALHGLSVYQKVKSAA
jgi:hypothetical protein